MAQQQGIIKRIFPAVRVKDNFHTREFDLHIEGTYPQTVRFQLTQSKCDLLNDKAVGQKVEIAYALNGREWQKPGTDEISVFNTLAAWKIDVIYN